jgi:hypothetical protein
MSEILIQYWEPEVQKLLSQKQKEDATNLIISHYNYSNNGIEINDYDQTSTTQMSKSEPKIEDIKITKKDLSRKQSDGGWDPCH